MTYFHACVGCQFKAPDCAHLTGIKTSLTGYGVTSVRHKCPAREPLYMPGEAVEVQTYPDYGQDDDGEKSPKCWFQGHFVRQQGAQAICIIRKDAQAIDDEEWTFTPIGNGGFVKVTLQRVRKRTVYAEDVIIKECSACGILTPLENCRHDEGVSWRPVGCLTKPELAVKVGVAAKQSIPSNDLEWTF